jgi:hypothetical protein
MFCLVSNCLPSSIKHVSAMGLRFHGMLWCLFSYWKWGIIIVFFLFILSTYCAFLIYVSMEVYLCTVALATECTIVVCLSNRAVGFGSILRTHIWHFKENVRNKRYGCDTCYLCHHCYTCHKSLLAFPKNVANSNRCYWLGKCRMQPAGSQSSCVFYSTKVR